uniref:Uncharacterized protein n=1 Tax=Cucumis melo TaxID=3656 RepID=A0A9I9ELJ0_CUCME
KICTNRRTPVKIKTDAGGKPFENLKNVRTEENFKKILSTRYFLLHAENREKI